MAYIVDTVEVLVAIFIIHVLSRRSHNLQGVITEPQLTWRSENTTGEHSLAITVTNSFKEKNIFSCTNCHMVMGVPIMYWILLPLCPSIRTSYLSLKKVLALYPSIRASYLSLKKVLLLCPSIRACYLSLKKVLSSLSFKKGNLFVHLFVPQNRHPICPSKRCYLFVPQNRHPICPSKRRYLLVPQKGHHICPSKRASYLSLKKVLPLCASKMASYLSLKKVKPFVPQ